MTPRHDKTPPPESLTQSQQDLLAIAQERIDEAVAKLQEHNTGEPMRSTPLPGDSAEMARRALEWLYCKQQGPCRGLAETVKEMQKVQQTQQDFINQYLGEQKFKRYALPILLGLMGSSVGALVVGLVIKGMQHAR